MFDVTGGQGGQGDTTLSQEVSTLSFKILKNFEFNMTYDSRPPADTGSIGLADIRLTDL